MAIFSPSSTVSPKPHNALPLHELLLLSPSPLRRSKTRLSERVEMAEEAVEPNGARKKCKNRNAAMGLVGCASPRNGRRSRKKLEHEIREEKDLGMVEEMGKARKRRHSGRSKKEKLSLVLSIPSPKAQDGYEYNLDQMGQLITDLIMWKDVAKSSLCIFSAISQLGLLFLAFISIVIIRYYRQHSESKVEEEVAEKGEEEEQQQQQALVAVESGSQK
ncbi:unnamed protein product [Ilex paraguariensis]|uniref:Uncharacterized protein n=1 Tax=Ilex paraguariensis TaxID=185542 RepID=A0ABC8SG98_9AQUA